MFSKAKEIDDGPAELESQFVLRLPVVSPKETAKMFVNVCLQLF